MELNEKFQPLSLSKWPPKLPWQIGMGRLVQGAQSPAEVFRGGKLEFLYFADTRTQCKVRKLKEETS